MTSIIVLLCGCLILSGCLSPQQPPTLETVTYVQALNVTQPSATPIPKVFRIVGYTTDWDPIIQIQYDKLTHINYAFLLPKVDGTFSSIANAGWLKEVVAQAHAHGVKVSISVGGWGYAAKFEKLAANTETRATFVEELNRFANDYALDGVDIDWEYPNPGPSAHNYLALMRELRTVLTKGKLLTSAVAASGSNGEGIPTEVFGLVDFLNIMAYDASSADHSPYSCAEEALDYWSERGLPLEKMVLGVPFYSRPGEVPYRKLVEENLAAAYTDVLDYRGKKVYYNGIPTIQKKTELALRSASGIMIWTLGYDTNDVTSLLSAIFHLCSEIKKY